MTQESTRRERQRAHGLLQAGQLRQALDAYVRLCEMEPGNAEDWHLRSAVCGMLGDFVEAERCGRKVATLAPGFAHGHLNLGTALLAQGRANEAAECFREALRHDASDPRIHQNLGSALRAQGALLDAERCFRESLRLRPGDPESLVRLATILEERGLTDEAIRFFGEAARHAPDSIEVWTRLGNALTRMKRFDAAADACRKALDLDPARAEGWYNLGCTYRDAGDRARAEPLFHAALERDPNLVEARYFLAWWGAGAVPPTAPAPYVRDLFDGYAEKFDEHLTGNLEYRSPELLAAAIREVCGGTPPPMDMLDLGCGTGLAGVALREWKRYLAGVDLSPKMIEKARARGLYDELIVGDILAPMDAVRERYDLIVSADVFVYVGDLRPTFRACTRALRAGGLFAFTTESAHDDEGYELRASGRYAHGDAYIRSLAGESGFDVVIVRDVVLRKEKREPMAGRLYILRSANL